MIMKKKWDEKGKTMQFEVKTRDGKSTFYRKTRKEVKESEKQQCPKKICFEEFWEVWQLSHARGNVVFQNFDIMSTFHGHCYRIHIKIFSALCGW